MHLEIFIAYVERSIGQVLILANAIFHEAGISVALLSPSEHMSADVIIGLRVEWVGLGPRIVDVES
jgi:hypothetical protein